METIRSVRVDTPTIRRLREAQVDRNRQNFLAGRFPLEWLSRAARAHPRGLEMLLLTKRAVDMAREQPVTVPDELCAEFGVTRQTRYRALRALEAAGLIRVEWHNGRLPRIRLREPEGLPSRCRFQPGSGL